MVRYYQMLTLSTILSLLRKLELFLVDSSLVLEL